MADINALSQGVDNPPGDSREPITHINVPNQRAGMANIELNTGMGGTGGLLPGMTREYSGWDVYNNEAKKVDTELVKDWTSNLNSLLLFAAIFAAVLTAFIIESKKLLEVDPADAMLSVMIFHTNNVANGTHTIYTQPEFIASSSAVTINCLFFASLSLSVVAALASVVALQWVGDYDAAITRGGYSPEDRAKRRQFRHAGVISWGMGEIIAVIPLFLYSSVMLFLSGLILWMWTVNQVVGIVIAGGAGVAVFFYGGTTMLAVGFVSAPFRTPLSRWIYSLLHLPLSLGYIVTRAIRVSSIRFWLVDRYGVWHERRLLAHVIPICEWLVNALRFSSVLPWLEKRHLNGRLPSKREDREVEKRKQLGVSALAWLANQLSISQDSHDRLLLLASEIPTLSVTGRAAALDIASLLRIFNFLSLNLLRKDIDQEITVEETHAVSILARCYRVPELRDLVSPTSGMHCDTDDTVYGYWRRGCGFPDHRYDMHQKFPEQYPNLLFLLFRDVPIPSGNEASEIEGTIRLSRWRNKEKSRPKDWCRTIRFGFINKYSSDAHSSYFFDEYTRTLWRYLRVMDPRWWSEMGRYLANEYEGPHLPFILTMQASVLPVLQDPKSLFREAYKYSELLVHLRHVFQYRVPCPEHYDGEGDSHFLLHMIDGTPKCLFTEDMTVYTSVPLKDRWLDCLLTLWILPRDQRELAMRELMKDMDPQCINTIMEMFVVVRNCQFAALALLSGHCTGMLRSTISTEHVMAISICVKDTLSLPWDPRAAEIALKLVNHVWELRNAMLLTGYRSAEENAAAEFMAKEAVDGLYTCIATTLVFGRQNIRILYCARASKGLSPAVGYLAPYIG